MKRLFTLLLIGIAVHAVPADAARCRGSNGRFIKCPPPPPPPPSTIAWTVAPLTDVSGYARAKIPCRSVWTPERDVAAGETFKLVIDPVNTPHSTPLSGIGWTGMGRVIAADGTTSWAPPVTTVVAVTPLVAGTLTLVPPSIYVPIDCLEGAMPAQ